MNRLVPLLCFLFLAVVASAQKKSQSKNTLLWRISGKGLNKPSYLFGTIHLADKKVFFLGDSVYSAIQRTEGFAAELDLNSIGIEMVNRFIREEQEKTATEPVRVKDAVNAEIWERYKDVLAKKFEKKAETIIVDDLDELQSSFEEEVFKNGEMTTFLDAHLFGLAKKKGKWVGGIEDIEDQDEHIKSLSNIEDKIQVVLYDEDYYRNSYDWLVNVYLNQQLDSIDASMYREGSGRKDYIMVKRNLKMARRMDSLSAIRSTFFAVGAGHLPGDSGVIALLKARGFELTPVISSKKIDPGKYVLKDNEAAWYPAEIRDSAYSLSMPGIADRLDYLESYGLSTKLFFDISFMKIYMTMSVELGEDRKKAGADSIYKGIKNQYSGEETSVKEKKVFINGLEGRELRFKNEDGYFIMQIFLPGMERVVFNGIMTMKEQPLEDADTKKFFESFVMNGNVRKPVQDELKWSSYSNVTQNFSIEFPAKPIEKKDVRSQEGKIIHSFQAVDLKSQAFYGISISSVKEGLYLSINDSVQFSALTEQMRQQFEEVSVVDSALFTFSGFPACKLLINATSEGNRVVLNILSVWRGNRNYYLFTVYEPSETTRMHAERYLNSFKLLPIKYADWKTQYSHDSSYSTTSPFPFRTNATVDEVETTKNYERLIVYDTLASHTLFVDRYTLPAWYWYSSDTAFLRSRTKRYMGWGDSLIHYNVTINGAVAEADFLAARAHESVIRKGKVILSGQEVFEVYTYVAPYDLEKYYHKFFDDFKILKAPVPGDISRHKAKELAALMEKGNKDDIEEIKRWWDDLEFTEKDLPLLQSMTLKVYPDLDSADYNSLNWKILQQIDFIDSSHKTIDFIKTNYNTITPENNKVKSLLLSFLSIIKEKSSFIQMKEILRDDQYPTDIKISYGLSVYDSLELSVILFPEIFKLTQSEHEAEQVYRITMTLVDSGLLDKQIVREHQQLFITNAANVLRERATDDDVHEYYDLVRILGVINTPASNKMLVQFSKFTDREMRFQTIITLLKNNLRVDPKAIYTLATTDEYRYKLFESLQKLNKQSLFPPDYLSQEKLASSKLYIDYQDDEYPSIFTAVGSKTILYKGKQQKVFLYKVAEAGEEDDPLNLTYYLAVAGPYSTNSKNYYSNHELTGIYWKKDFDKSKLDQLLREYINSLQDQQE